MEFTSCQLTMSGFTMCTCCPSNKNSRGRFRNNHFNIVNNEVVIPDTTLPYNIKHAILLGVLESIREFSVLYIPKNTRVWNHSINNFDEQISSVIEKRQIIPNLPIFKVLTQYSTMLNELHDIEFPVTFDKNFPILQFLTHMIIDDESVISMAPSNLTQNVMITFDAHQPSYSCVHKTVLDVVEVQQFDMGGYNITLTVPIPVAINTKLTTILIDDFIESQYECQLSHWSDIELLLTTAPQLIRTNINNKVLNVETSCDTPGMPITTFTCNMVIHNNPKSNFKTTVFVKFSRTITTCVGYNILTEYSNPHLKVEQHYVTSYLNLDDCITSLVNNWRDPQTQPSNKLAMYNIHTIVSNPYLNSTFSMMMFSRIHKQIGVMRS